MTEAEWLTCDEPQTLIEFVAHSTSERKCRLLAAALCRHVLPLVTAACGPRAVEIAEAYADGFVTKAEMRAACERTSDAYVTLPNPAPVNTEAPLAFKAASIAVQATMFAASEFEDYLVSCCICTEKACVRSWLLQARSEEVRPDYVVLMRWQQTLTRDIFGNPFRPIAVDPTWLTPVVVALARYMYDSRDFGVMPTLAEALQEAGCTNEDILDHCRDVSAPHVRGCWVVDLLLGKE